MEKIRSILYGVADYAEIRKSNAWFVDRTAKIRDLETTRYVVCIRPRRFGKSLLLSIIEACHDVADADGFEQSFAGMKGIEPGIKAKAIDQLDRYSADPARAAKRHLRRSTETGDALPPPARACVSRRRLRADRRSVR